jgi:mannose/cellobiose epimerase-like protein (N-acyl-D-glucosamine 2-epimerase family)
MFRPAGTTPGHSFELSRLMLQYWDLSGRPEGTHVENARGLLDQALKDAWHDDLGGFVYTLNFDGSWDNAARYWWPVTEAIGTVAAFQKLAPTATDDMWYRRLWKFSEDHLIDANKGGWFPELDASNAPSSTQFAGKPDIYHAIQATLFPQVGALSNITAALS